jgi:photosystem II stability/assembly factor-like uncharacterized protein
MSRTHLFFFTIVLTLLFGGNVAAQWVKIPDPPSVPVRLFGAESIVLTNNLSRSTDNGLTWMAPDSGSPNNSYFSAFCSENLTIYTAIGGPNEGVNFVFKSTDAGQQWMDITHNIGQMPTLSLACNGTTVFAGLYLFGLYRSTNGGETWTALGGPGFLSNCQSVAVKNNVVLAGFQWSGLRRSTNGGSAWSKITNGFRDSASTYRLHFIGSVAIAETDSGMLRSTDDGVSWLPVVYQSKRIYTVNSAVRDSTIFIITTSGQILQSRNGGTTWDALDGGLHGQIGSILAVTDSFLFAKTNSGIWRRSMPTLVTEVNDGRDRITPKQFSLHQNFPNPFNPMTTFAFELPKSSFVSLRIIDVLGKEVATLVSQELFAGKHEVQWDATGNSSGIYFYRLQAGTFSETKKLIVLR